MRLPVQARPVARSTSSAGLRLSVTQSGFCEIACNLLPEPLRFELSLLARERIGEDFPEQLELLHQQQLA